MPLLDSMILHCKRTYCATARVLIAFLRPVKNNPLSANQRAEIRQVSVGYSDWLIFDWP